MMLILNEMEILVHNILGKNGCIVFGTKETPLKGKIMDVIVFKKNLENRVGKKR